MRPALLLGSCITILGIAAPGLCQDSLLFDTWTRSKLDPAGLDSFMDQHRAQYTDEYFACSQEAQRLLRDEANVRNKRCDFSGDSRERDHCRRDNPFRGLDSQLADLDRTVRGRTPWLDTESGRQAEQEIRNRQQFESSCSGSACAVAKRKEERALREITPYLQCPPVPQQALDVDPSFRTFELPSDPGG
ncbi:MAG TPA: hypothetical protein VFS39_13250 [Nitrospira sp.]|nr:hypothetical protein [Nitrospira sp.]